MPLLSCLMANSIEADVIGRSRRWSSASCVRDRGLSRGFERSAATLRQGVSGACGSRLPQPWLAHGLQHLLDVPFRGSLARWSMHRRRIVEA